VAPINLQDWQLQQKALKDKERMKKTDAEAILHGYRGKDEVKSQLSSIKQQDRKGKQDAEAYLHGYRAGVGDVRTPPKDRKGTKGHPGMAPESYDSAGAGVGAVSVADLAENYNQSGQAEGELMPGTYRAGGEANANPPSLVDEAKDQHSPNGSSESGIMVESPTQQEASNSADAVNTSVEEWEHVETSEAPPEEVARAAELVIQEQETVIGDTEPPLMDTVESDAGAEPRMTVAGSSESPKQVEPMRLDVDFSFSLLFSDFMPNVDKYMAATSEIASSIQSVMYNSAFGPFVRDVQEDTSFVAPAALAGAKKCVVRATVPVFIMPGADVAGSRNEVWRALRAAIEDGSFLEIAKRH
jgi:hypothetical protein